MSNTCPKCGAGRTDSVGWSCGSFQLTLEFYQSPHCRGRQEAREELLQWNTGEPPEGTRGIRVIVKGGGSTVLAKMHKGKLVVDNLGPVKWNPDWQWREVQP